MTEITKQFTEKNNKNKACIGGLNDSVARKIARREFGREAFNDLVYNEKENRFDVSIKVDIDSMGEKERKKLKEKITAFEQDKEWLNVFKVQTLNIVEL